MVYIATVADNYVLNEEILQCLGKNLWLIIESVLNQEWVIMACVRYAESKEFTVLICTLCQLCSAAVVTTGLNLIQKTQQRSKQPTPGAFLHTN